MVISSKKAALASAMKRKDDEFYTLLSDIEREVWQYKDHFKGKVVYCNCDNWRISNFWKFFNDNFDELKLKKLIATYYERGEPQPVMNSVYYQNGLRTSELRYAGNGDFKSDECIAILKESDVVVSNPPFSLFRTYMTQLFECKKKFLVIGNLNAVAYKEIFPFIKKNELWLGTGKVGMDFLTPSGNIEKTSSVWFTNLKHGKDTGFIPLTEKYDKAKYPEYDDYNAINVNKTKSIPCDYVGAMGVPLSFIVKYNPKQFELIDCIGRNSIMFPEVKKKGREVCAINGKNFYKRLIIKNKKLQ